MRYRVARSGLHEGNDWKQRFLSRIIRQRLKALQVVQVPRAELLLTKNKKRLWKIIILFRLTRKHVV